jgi:hypothetical protein
MDSSQGNLPLALTLVSGDCVRLGNSAIADLRLGSVFGVMNAYGVWKALEWGTAADLTPYTWVGFVETEEGKAVGPKESKEDLEELRRKQAKEDGPLDIISWTILLLGSMRGES